MPKAKVVSRPKTSPPFGGLSKKRLREMAGDRYYGRGEEYFGAGAVESLRVWGNEARAEVMGNDLYDVRLWDSKGIVDGNCSCPAYEEIGHCKHFVAAGLALLKWIGEGRPANNAEKGWVTLDGLKERLEQQDKSRLVDWLMRIALEKKDWLDFFEEETGRQSRNRGKRKDP